MSIKNIVTLSISRNTRAISQEGFGVANIVGKNLNSVNRIEYFSINDLSAIATRLIGGTSSPEYLAIASAASQTPRPSRVAISQITAPKIATFTGTYTAGTITAKICGHDITQVFDTSRAVTLTALATQIQDLDEVQTCGYVDGTGVLTITPATGYLISEAFTLTSITGTLTVVLSTGTPSETYTDGLAAISLVDNEWYGFGIISRTQSDVELAVAWAQSNKKVFSTSSSNTNIIDVASSSDTTSIAAFVNNGTYDRTMVIYDPNANTEYNDFGVLTNFLARNPGSYTGMFKSIGGMAAYSLTTTQETNALNKNCNIYEKIKGITMIREATVGGGEYFDIMHFIDWFEARLCEAVFGLLSRLDKVPYSPEGLVLIKAEIDEVGQAGIDAKGFTKEAYDSNKVQVGGFYSTMPDFATISTNDKAARVLNNVQFTGFLAGAVHAVAITGVVTY